VGTLGSTTASCGSIDYIDFTFSAAAGSIAYNDESSPIPFYVHRSPNWSNYDQSNDYSFNGNDRYSSTGYMDWSHMTLYRNGTLVWGTEP
jgi:hypothetical protein